MTFDHTYASAIVGAQKTHKRKEADFYPSPPDVTVGLVDYLMQRLDLCDGTRVWEPACGDGAMSKVLEAHGLHVTSTDLRRDSGYGQGGVDFLNTDPLDYDPEWIITNPPFNVAADFIEHALRFTPNVAMLLKSQYWHAASRLPLYKKHTPAEILPLTWRPAFLEAERGSSPLMDVIWCVWRRGDTSARYYPLARPIGSRLPRKTRLLARPYNPIDDL